VQGGINIAHGEGAVPECSADLDWTLITVKQGSVYRCVWDRPSCPNQELLLIAIETATNHTTHRQDQKNCSWYSKKEK